MTPQELNHLKLTAVRARQLIIEAIHAAGTGHPGGSLSAIDYLTYLYQAELRVDPSDRQNPDRDRFVLSKGHVAPALYAALAQKGFFPEAELLTLRQPGSRLQGHPNMHDTPGVEFSTGSLGQGFSAAVGMAKGADFLKKDFRVYALLGDGELDEGEVWEAAAYASNYHLDHLCIAADINGLQIDGPSSEVMNMEPIDRKFESFGFHVIKIDGHDFEAMEQALSRFHENIGTGRPTCILLKTVKGKGVSFMENAVGWHGKAPNDKEFEQAMKELKQEEEKIKEA
ncbi:MAG: transketolase [Lachnospiraceae bacterium]|jgi:transketolase|nr:transketolase [Lachnospiraceae bacterium]MCI1328312.1 transketolase [Lachnospiraceae bacterium]